MKLASLSSDHIWRPIVFILAGLVVLQLIFSRHVYDVTVYTYRIMQSYYLQDGLWAKSINNSGIESLDNFQPNNVLINYKNRSAVDTVLALKANGSGIAHLSKTAAGSMAVNVTCNASLGSTFTYIENPDPHSLNTSAGGEWKPQDCLPKTSVALIIPFRARHAHLRTFVPYMHAFLQKQQLSYRIYVIEQHDNSSFNRAKLMNVGYREAAKHRKYNCYVFHDVDLLPLDERIGYNCSDKGPVHLAAGMDKFGFAMPYSGFFGGACAFTESQLEKINGFSNKFVGWGGEDDDIDARVRLSGQIAQRYPVQIARYHMIKHGADKGNEANPARHRLMEQSKLNWRNEGLNSLTYKVVNVTEELLYTNVAVDVA